MFNNYLIHKIAIYVNDIKIVKILLHEDGYRQYIKENEGLHRELEMEYMRAIEYISIFSNETYKKYQTLMKYISNNEQRFYYGFKIPIRTIMDIVIMENNNHNYIINNIYGILQTILLKWIVDKRLKELSECVKRMNNKELIEELKFVANTKIEEEKNEKEYFEYMNIIYTDMS